MTERQTMVHKTLHRQTDRKLKINEQYKSHYKLEMNAGVLEVVPAPLVAPLYCIHYTYSGNVWFTVVVFFYTPRKQSLGGGYILYIGTTLSVRPSMYLVSATPPKRLIWFLWNFTHLWYITCRCAWRNMVAVQNLKGEIIQLILSRKRGCMYLVSATPTKLLIEFL